MGELSLWDRNFQLSLASLPIYIIIAFSPIGGVKEFSYASFFVGWSPEVVVVAFLAGAGGITVAMVLKYADAVLKCIATIGSLVSTTLLSHYLLGGPLTSFIGLAAAYVMIGTMNYVF